ncbi:hypothetical protein ASF24_19055 [Methylobacterium sp. Leaf86]|uniref:hypothetical protein n=1 Tax=Methylobacterium sp. Leaf86 TaxID=1736242 RepID=UPI0006F5FACA|nr:hypothetical protein [Methylobacterium sp. Leaf86]KQO56429.1 hypothetical protein ASF24_19055 [Methylobacterium sp. Leaf86]
MTSLSELASTLRHVASPGIKPKDLIAAVREKYPEATKKEIVRAAFFSLSDGHDANPRQTEQLYDFALKERGEEERTVTPHLKRKGKRERNGAKAAKASA